MNKPKPSAARLGRINPNSIRKRPQMNRYGSRLLAAGQENSERGELVAAEALQERRLKIAGTTAVSLLYVSSIIYAGLTDGLSYAFSTGILMLPVLAFGLAIYLFKA